METLQLNAIYRTDMRKTGLKQVRRSGRAPASVFGHGTSPVSVEVSVSELAAIVRESKSGLNALFNLKISGAPENVDGPVLIKTIHKHAVTRKVLDIEFQRIRMDEKVTVNVPIVILGTPIGLKAGGSLEEGTTELHLRCLPNNIPSQIEIDVSDLEVGQHISVGDIKVPDGVEILTDSDATVCACAFSRAAMAGADVSEADGAAVVSDNKE